MTTPLRYDPKEEVRFRLIRNFTYQPPKGDQAERYVAIRDKFKDLALFLIEVCPESRELSLALTHIEEANLWCNAAIARNE